MRLRRLDLARYGRFTGFSIDFGERSPEGSDFHIIYGDNEAGKSTAFDGYLDVLFGIEERSKYDFLHDYSAMRVGAVLGIDGGEIELARIKRRDGNLIGAANQPLDPAILTSALHGLSRNAYQTMFSLNDETLEHGGDEILASKGDLGRLLFAATAGLAELSDGLDALRESADEFYFPKSRSNKLKTLKDELARLDEQRRSLDTQASAFEGLTETRRQTEAAYREARDHRDDLRKEQDRLSPIRDALSIRNELIAIEEKMAPLALLPVPLPGGNSEVGSLKQALAAAEAKKADAEDDIETQDGKLATLEADPGITDAREEIAVLELGAGRDRSEEEDLPKRREERLKVEAMIGEIRGRIGADEQASHDELIIPDDRLELLDRLSAAEPALRQSAVTARKEATASEDTLRTARNQLEAAPVPGEELVSLRELLEQLENDDARQRLSHAEEALTRIEAAIDRDIRKLAPWTGSAEDLAARKLPGPEQANRWRDRSKALQQELNDLKSSRTLHRVARDRSAGVLGALSSQGSAIADDDAAGTRKLRDEAWTAHRARLDDASADAFEGALREDDRVRDERLEAADRLAKMRIEETAIAAEDASIEAIGREIGGRSSALGAVGQEMMPVIAAAGLPAEFEAEDLVGWLERAERLRDTIGDAADLRAKQDAAAADCETQSASLIEALTSLGVQMPDKLGFEQLRARARRLTTLAIEDKASYASVEKAVAAAEEDKRHRDKALAKADEALEAWKTSWSKAFSDLWLEQRDSAQMRALLDPLRRLATQASLHTELLGRIRAMEKNRREFSDAVNQLAARLDANEHEHPAATFEHLKSRLAAADKANTQRRGADEARARAKKRLARAETELSRIEKRMKAMSEHFPNSETISNLDELADMLAQADLKTQLAGTRDEKERELLDRLRASSRSDADDRLDAEAETDLEASLAEIEGDLREAETDLEDRIGARRDAVRAIENIGGDAAVALLEEERRTILMEIAERANRAIALQLGVMAAHRALAAYRDRHRSALMSRTADAFRSITGGEFVDLTTQADRPGDRLIAIRSDGGGSIGAEEMSKGTRFQLYLALRLAGYRRFCDVAGPLPFIGDDVMEKSDDRRAAATINLLGEAALVGQALYFTHHNGVVARIGCQVLTQAFATTTDMLNAA